MFYDYYGKYNEFLNPELHFLIKNFNFLKLNKYSINDKIEINFK
jgi:hypothetical protein